jgi:nucleoside-diphosphate-sugar epimerase
MGTDRKLALVTGAAGLVGDRIAKRLLRDGLLVRTLDQRPVDVAGAESCQADVTDPVAVQRAAAGAALVVHCAAVITGTPEEMLWVNVEGTRLLAETALQQGANASSTCPPSGCMPSKGAPWSMKRRHSLPRVPRFS